MIFNKLPTVNTNSSNGTQYNAGKDIYLKEVPIPKASAIQRLLLNIVNIQKKEEDSLNDEDYRAYSIEKKISFNEIDIYEKFLDDFRDGYAIIETRIQDLEVNGFANVRQLLINYVCKKYRRLSCKNISPDDLIDYLDLEISNELKDIYLVELSLDEINHVNFLIFHVFAKCKIFVKPPIDY